jgi:hypothetical protein
MATIGDMPVVECPGCFVEWQWDDYYEIRPGTERECPHCATVVIVTEVDQVIRATLEVKGFEKRS